MTIAALVSADFAVPPVDPEPGRVGWLRASVPRFSSGPVHRARRELTEAELSRVDVDTLRKAAYDRALGTTGAAHDVPVTVLAEALGAKDISPGGVAAVAAVYLTGSSGDPAAEAALGELVTAFGGVADERTAALIGLLVQTYSATAALIGAALDTGAATGDLAVAQALRDRPPVPRTRRVAVVDTRLDGQAVAAGTVVPVDLSGAPFGAGAHACPGRDLALAMAAAVVDAALTDTVRP